MWAVISDLSNLTATGSVEVVGSIGAEFAELAKLL